MQKLNKTSITALCLVLAFVSASFAGKKGGSGQTGNEGESLQKLKDEWRYHRKIMCSAPKNRYRYFYLDGDVYRNARGDLADLRIVDKDGRFAPFYLEHGSTGYRSAEVRYASKPIANRIDARKRRAYFDFQVIPVKKRIAGDRLLLSVTGTEYSKQVVVYGRRTDSDWDEITRDSIYHFGNYTKTVVELGGEYDYAFYRIEVIDNTANVSVTKLVLAGSTGSTFQRLTHRFNPAFTVRNDSSATTVSISNPDRYRIYRLDIAAGGTYNREYTLYMMEESDSGVHRGAGKKREVPLENGSLYNFDFKNVAVSNKTIGFPDGPIAVQDIYVRILNGNDRPLEPEKIEAFCYIDRVVFRADSVGDYELYFGNDGAAAPRYDIETYRGYVEKEDKDVCTCAPVAGSDRAGGGEAVSGTTLKIILNVTIVLVSLILVFFLVKKVGVKK